jgi:Tubulin binding cofactor A
MPPLALNLSRTYIYTNDDIVLPYAIFRIYKEWQYYQQEVIDNQATLQNMKDQENSDPFDIKQFEKVVGESCMMVPDSQQRYQDALCDLRDFIHHHHQQNDETATTDLSRSEWYPIAREILNQHQHPQETSRSSTKDHSDHDDDDDVVVVPETDVNDLADDEAF